MPEPMPPRAAAAPKMIALAWVDFQARTLALAQAMNGRAHFINAGPFWQRPLLLPLRYLRDGVVTWRLLSRERPDIVVAITPPVFAPLIAWLWCRLNGARLVMDCHTGAFHSRKWGWTRPIHRWLAPRVRAVSLHGEGELAEVSTWTDTALLLPDDVPVRSDQEPRSELASRTAGRRPRVVVAGSFNSDEPVVASIEAARLLPDVELLFTGDTGLLPPELMARAAENAVFTGWLQYPRFLDALEGADVVATFSLSPEMMNRAAFEAVAVGRALVLTDFPRLRERFGDAAEYAANESLEMAAAIRRALAARTQLEERSIATRSRLIAMRAAALEKLAGMVNAAGRGDPRAPRVLVVSQHPYPTHPLLRRNVAELLAGGAQVDLVCMDDPAADAATLDQPGLRLHRVALMHRRDSRLRYPLEYALFFVQALLRISALSIHKRFEVVQVDTMPDFLVFSAFAARWRGARIILYLFELMPELTAARLRVGRTHPMVRLAYALERAAVGWSDHVIAVNEACRAALDRRGVDPRKVSVIPNALRFPAELRACDARRPIIVTHATLIERYGAHVGIEAFAELQRTRPGLRMLVLGDGEQLPALRALAAELGVADAVEFPGNLPWYEAMSRIRECAVGIVPVLSDGYGEFMVPMKLYDYASMGIPVVSSRLPAIQNYFSPESVSYVEPGDVDELAAAIARLLDDPGIARRQVCSADQAMQPLDWDNVRAQYLALMGTQPMATQPMSAAGERR